MPSHMNCLSNMLGFLYIQGFCPGLTHGQRYGISYVSTDDSVEDESTTTKPVPVVENYPVVVVTNHSSDVETDPDRRHKPNEDQGHESNEDQGHEPNEDQGDEQQIDNRAETEKGGD